MKRNTETASAFIAALVTILIITVLLGVASTVTSTVTKVTDSSRDFSALRYEAEGALDVAYGTWLTAANNKYGPPTSTDIPTRLSSSSTTSLTFNYPYASGTGTKLQISMTDQYGQPVSTGTATAVPIHMAGYPGWQGLRYSYLASVRLTGTYIGGKSLDYGVKRTIEYVSVPLFQAMAFFEGDIEIYQPATMTIGGLVHTNGSAYLSGQTASGLTFTGDVSYSAQESDPTAADPGYTTTTPPVGGVAWAESTNGTNKAPTMYTPVFPSGASNQVAEVDPMEPLGSAPEQVLNTTDANDNNDSMHELIDRPDSAYTDPSAIAGRRLYNKAGIIITITGTAANQTTITTQNGVTLTSAQITTLKSAISHTSGNAFYDQREGKYVDVSTLDVSIANPVFNAASGFSTNGVLYMDDTSSAGASDPKAIRLKNGGTLPTAGLTVASDNGIYIQGDYNTGSTSSTVNSVPANSGGNSNGTDSPVVPGYTRAPSAVIGDAVMILSNAWSDSNSHSSLSSRSASNTTINTAIVAGFIPSGWTNNGTVSAYGYSGGLNNFPRLLENWSNISFTYYGSLVQLYTSKTFIGQWDTGSIYSAPNRWWNYDSNFLTKPPPGSLDVVTRSRGALVRY